MLILATKLFRSPVVSAGTGKLGELGEPIVDPQNGRLIAFFVSGGIFEPKKIISIGDILMLNPQITIVNNPDSVLPPNEIVRVDQFIKSRIKFLKSKACTKNKTYLGTIEDVVIDTETQSIIKYYIKNIIRDRILPSDLVVEIQPDKIIFEDSVLDRQTAAGAAA